MASNRHGEASHQRRFVGGNPVQTRLGPGQRNSKKIPGAQAIILRGSLASVVRWGGVRTAVQRSGGTAEQGARRARVLEVALVDERGRRGSWAV